MPSEALRCYHVQTSLVHKHQATLVTDPSTMRSPLDSSPYPTDPAHCFSLLKLPFFFKGNFYPQVKKPGTSLFGPLKGALSFSCSAAGHSRDVALDWPMQGRAGVFPPSASLSQSQGQGAGLTLMEFFGIAIFHRFSLRRV